MIVMSSKLCKCTLYFNNMVSFAYKNRKCDMDVSLQQLKRELASKERNIFELSEYISNRNETDRTPNYSLLLGAGCSISSGIRPASTLISAWKEEIYLSSNDVDDNLNLLECVNDYFESDAVASWYDPRNEYCCLFEKI